MKQIKTFLFSTVPFFLAIALQFVAAYYLLFIAAIFMFVVAPMANGTIYDMNDLMELTVNQDFTTVLSVCFSIFCIALFSIWFYKIGGNYKINLKKNIHAFEILGIVLLVPGAQFLSGMVTGIVSTIFPAWLEEYMELMESAGLTGEISLLMMTYSVLLAPISEELIYRGVTFGILRKAFPFWIANILQAMMFGIFHMNALQGCYTFVVGLIFGYVREKGGTIYHVILYHMLFNLWGTTASQWLTLADENTQAAIVLIGMSVGLTAGLYLFNKGTSSK